MSNAQQRLAAIASQVAPGGDSPAKKKLLEKNPDDVVSRSQELRTEIWHSDELPHRSLLSRCERL